MKKPTIIQMINRYQFVQPSSVIRYVQHITPRTGIKDRLLTIERMVITIDDLRREYQQLLDRCSRIERGDFDFDMDEQESEDEAGGVPGEDGTGGGDAMEL